MVLFSLSGTARKSFSFHTYKLNSFHSHLHLSFPFSSTGWVLIFILLVLMIYCFSSLTTSTKRPIHFHHRRETLCLLRSEFAGVRELLSIHKHLIFLLLNSIQQKLKVLLIWRAAPTHISQLNVNIIQGCFFFNTFLMRLGSSRRYLIHIRASRHRLKSRVSPAEVFQSSAYSHSSLARFLLFSLLLMWWCLVLCVINFEAINHFKSLFFPPLSRGV